MNHQYCECKEDLTPHDYVVTDFGEEGYLCRNCKTLKEEE